MRESFFTSTLVLPFIVDLRFEPLYVLRLEGVKDVEKVSPVRIAVPGLPVREVCHEVRVVFKQGINLANIALVALGHFNFSHNTFLKHLLILS